MFVFFFLLLLLLLFFFFFFKIIIIIIIIIFIYFSNYYYYLIYFAFRYIRYISGCDSGACVCCASFECECMMTRMFALCMPVCSAADALVVAARCC